MNEVGLVLDTSALLSYAEGGEIVGRSIAVQADEGLSVLIPAACLAAAHKDVTSEGWPYPDDLNCLPAGARSVCRAWRLGTQTWTSAGTRRRGTAGHPIVPLMTAHRDLVIQFLPKEWPIIDVE